jgi:hypothetical protein
MEAFDPQPPEWTIKAVHAFNFCCPRCQAPSLSAQKVWLNRRSPVYNENNQRKWQEFYLCQCDQTWWAWSTDRPPSPFGPKEDEDEDQDFNLDDF